MGFNCPVGTESPVVFRLKWLLLGFPFLLYSWIISEMLHSRSNGLRLFKFYLISHFTCARFLLNCLLIYPSY